MNIRSLAAVALSALSLTACTTVTDEQMGAYDKIPAVQDEIARAEKEDAKTERQSWALMAGTFGLMAGGIALIPVHAGPPIIFDIGKLLGAAPK